MTERELMQQALEALELFVKYENPNSRIQVRKPRDGGPIVTIYPKRIAMEAAAPLRKRLAQPEHEPVAHTLNCVCGAVWDVSPDGVEEMVRAPNPPHRKPLGDEEISDLWCKVSNTDFVTIDTHEFARAIEAAHGIKGEA